MTRFGTMAAALAAVAVLAGCGGGGGSPGAGNTGNDGNTGNTGVNPGNNGNGGDPAPAPDTTDATHGSLSIAISRGDAAEVRRLIRAGANPNQPDEVTGTLLHFAATLGTERPASGGGDRVAVVRELLAGGANPNSRSPQVLNNTPLHNIVAAVVNLIIDVTGTRASIIDNPDETLVRQGLEIVRLLLDAGADPNARDSGGNTSLGAVAAFSETNVYQRLRNVFQNAGGSSNGNGNNAGNNGNGGQTCPAGQTGTPPNCRSGNSQSQRGPGHTDTLGGARAALAALDGRAQRLTPIYAEANCHSGSERRTCNTRDRVPTIGVAGAGLRHPGGMGWAVPTDVGPYRQFVGQFRDGDRYTFGAWGEWSYAYTARGGVENLRSNSTTTRRHGTAIGSGGCDNADYGCSAFYALANHGGLLYGGTPAGTATYEGRTRAVILRADAGAVGDQAVIAWGGIYSGDTTLTADFDRSSVNARFHDFTGSEPELRNGITFSGIPLIGSDGQFRQDTGGRYINGAFFGPDGTEAAGTWYVDGTTPTRQACGAGGNSQCNDGHVIIGSFVTTGQ